MGEIYDFYNAGAEIGRLERGLGIVEFYRTKEILSRYIGSGQTIYARRNILHSSPGEMGG